MYQIYFILEWHSTCFGRSFRPSSGVQDCTHISFPLASRQQYLFDCLLLHVQSWTPDDGRKDRPKHVDCQSQIKFETMVHLVGFIIETRSFLFRMRNVSDKRCSENQNTHFVLSDLFFLNRAIFLENVEKYCGVGQVTDGNMAHAHCMLHTWGYK